MTAPLTDNEYENLRMVYNAIIAYHNDLANMRFTVAGLYLAATGFLLGSVFADPLPRLATYAIPSLGLIVTFLCVLLDMRTAHLLRNLGDRGGKIERDLKISDGRGFFALMQHQDVPARIPLTKWEVDRAFPHHVALYLLYLLTGIFWLALLLWPGLRRY